jgi:hypothetical protein
VTRRAPRDFDSRIRACFVLLLLLLSLVTFLSRSLTLSSSVSVEYVSVPPEPGRLLGLSLDDGVFGPFDAELADGGEAVLV